MTYQTDLWGTMLVVHTAVRLGIAILSLILASASLHLRKKSKRLLVGCLGAQIVSCIFYCIAMTLTQSVFTLCFFWSPIFKWYSAERTIFYAIWDNMTNYMDINEIYVDEATDLALKDYIGNLSNMLTSSDILAEWKMTAYTRSSRAYLYVSQDLEKSSENIVSLGTALLALDRMILMANPVWYKMKKVSRKLALSNAFVSTVLVSFLVITATTDAIINPYLSDWHYDLNLNYLNRIYSGFNHLEIVISIIFCVQFSLYAGKQSNGILPSQTRQTNQITLFQVLSLIAFVMFPFYAPKIFGFRHIWISVLVGKKSTFFALHVLLTSTFTWFKLWKSS
ncbi:hypothetical protein QR680_015791 [Steinernema hermaphroditum]|uniref:Uncharacterized protein n=1 Tax=Steinernema hermaphroditum TaxID=289476 RepID=A0AA39LLH5_9BILA|nr:hypothetical protein QR680_015791 [Steinernema hermaphroditum]